MSHLTLFQDLYSVSVIFRLLTQLQVQFATANNITFLAKSGGHGLSTSLSRVRNAIMIDMRGLNYARYDNATSQVAVGGGITTGELINATHAAGKEISMSTPHPKL